MRRQHCAPSTHRRGCIDTTGCPLEWLRHQPSGSKRWNMLQGVAKTQCLLDDIIIAGADEDEHFKILEEVLSRLSRRNMTINMEKCAFFQDSLKFCGHRIDAAGLHMTPSKITAVVEVPNPQDISQLRAFLGLVNYYNRFLPNLASVLVPLHKLLQKKTKWHWATDCERAFQEVKQMIASERVLTHFNPDVPLLVSCDASPYGLGAVLSHVCHREKKNQLHLPHGPFPKRKVTIHR